MRTLTIKEYKELEKIQLRAFHIRCTMKVWNPYSVRLNNCRKQWINKCNELGILSSDKETAVYQIENGKSYSHGYNFGDLLA